MENDAQFRVRLLDVLSQAGTYLTTQQIHAIQTSPGELLDSVGRSWGVDRQHTTDPFGAAVKAAQDQAEARPSKSYVPDVFDRDEVWRAIMEQG